VPNFRTPFLVEFLYIIYVSGFLGFYIYSMYQLLNYIWFSSELLNVALLKIDLITNFVFHIMNFKLTSIYAENRQTT
jgi:hypothetical protein